MNSILYFVIITNDIVFFITQERNDFKIRKILPPKNIRILWSTVIYFMRLIRVPSVLPQYLLEEVEGRRLVCFDRGAALK